MDWFVNTLRDNPAIAIFLTLGIGFWVGRFKYKSFTLGTVTSVLLVGVLVGQLDIPISGPLKSVFFLLFLFAIGYSVGPQFFAALRGSGVKQVLFALMMTVLVLGCTWATALLFGYDTGEAAGLYCGAQTMSAVIGVADDTINGLNVPAATKQQWINIIPVAYAVTYIWGTIGSAWIIGSLGPIMLGGFKKVRERTRELEQEMNDDPSASDPSLVEAARPVVHRAYRVAGDYFATPRTVAEIEGHIVEQGRRGFVDRLRHGSAIDSDITPKTVVSQGDTVVLSGRRELILGDEAWIGPEVADQELLNFPVERVPVMVSRKEVVGTTVGDFRRSDYARGVIISSIRRGGTELPVMVKTQFERGDVVTLVGLKSDVDSCAAAMGYVDRPTTVTDMVFVGLAIFIGAMVGAVTVRMGGVPISLSTSGGALIAGLVFGWLRTKRPTVGHIPDSVVWIFNNLGLNMFIAVVGITAGPTFITGLQQVGWQLLLAGIIATSTPLILAIWLGDKVFKFHPAICLGCVAGGRTTTAALGAVQDSLGSTVPAMGYTITYAIGNTTLILAGMVMVLVM